VNKLSQTVVHCRVKERQVVPTDLAAEQVLEYVSVQVEWTDLILQQTEPDDSETTNQPANQSINGVFGLTA